MTNQNGYVRIDEDGVMRVADTHVMMDSVVAAFEKGHSPETILSQFPSLSLEQVYGAITWYLAHRSEVDAYLHRQDALWTEWRQKSGQDSDPLVQRLRTLKAASTEAKP